MLIIGHAHIPFSPLYRVENIENIKKTPPNSTLFARFSEESISLIQHCQTNDIPIAVEVYAIKDALICENLDVKYLVAQKKLALELQPVAENYLFDSKLLAWCGSESEMEQIAKSGIDGVLFKEAIKASSPSPQL